MGGASGITLTRSGASFVQDLNLMSPVRNLSLKSPSHRADSHSANAPASQAAANSILLSDDIMVTRALSAQRIVLCANALTDLGARQPWCPWSASNAHALSAN